MTTLIIVHCVVCVDLKSHKETVHIFSTAEKALAFSEHDQRPHVHYEYVVDEPERFEGAMQ
jgi:hypothetical protein